MTSSNDTEGQNTMTDTSSIERLQALVIELVERIDQHHRKSHDHSCDDELAEVIDDFSTGMIGPDDPRLDVTYPVTRELRKPLRHWTYDDVQTAYGRLNGPGIEDGDLVFYAEASEIGRFSVGAGDVVGGDGCTRIGIVGPLAAEPGSSERCAAFYLTVEEAKGLAACLREVVTAVEEPW
ncbi:MAG: hypothetical protein QM658_03240 [Gordonia sp. (in: high G+C Gram-positive bacteria)]